MPFNYRRGRRNAARRSGLSLHLQNSLIDHFTNGTLRPLAVDRARTHVKLASSEEGLQWT